MAQLLHHQHHIYQPSGNQKKRANRNVECFPIVLNPDIPPEKREVWCCFVPSSSKRCMPCGTTLTTCRNFPIDLRGVYLEKGEFLFQQTEHHRHSVCGDKMIVSALINRSEEPVTEDLVVETGYVAGEFICGLQLVSNEGKDPLSSSLGFLEAG